MNEQYLENLDRDSKSVSTAIKELQDMSSNNPFAHLAKPIIEELEGLKTKIEREANRERELIADLEE